MTKEEYEKIKGELLWVIESGESKQAAAATASLMQLEDAWVRTKLMAELDADELYTDETEEEEHDEEQRIILAQRADC